MSLEDRIRSSVDEAARALVEQLTAHVAEAQQAAVAHASETAWAEAEQAAAARLADAEARLLASMEEKIAAARDQGAKAALQQGTPEALADAEGRIAQAEMRVQLVQSDAEGRVQKAVDDAAAQVEQARDQADARVRKAEEDAAERLVQADARVKKAEQDAAGQLHRAQADAEVRVQRARTEAEARIQAALADADARVAASVAAGVADAVSRERDAGMAGMSRLLESIRGLDGASSQSEMLDALALAAGREAARAAVIALRSDRLQGWKLSGFGARDKQPKGVDMAIGEAGIVGLAVTTTRTVNSKDGHAGPGFDQLPADRMGLAVPVLVEGRVIAVVYADGVANSGDERFVPSGWPEAVEVLARHAGRCLEALAARRKPGVAGAAGAAGATGATGAAGAAGATGAGSASRPEGPA